MLEEEEEEKEEEEEGKGKEETGYRQMSARSGRLLVTGCL